MLLAVLVFAAPRPAMAQPEPDAAYLDTLGVDVPAGENRPFSYTDKRSAYFYGRTHENRFGDYFAGWNVGRQRVLQDYTLGVDGEPLEGAERDSTLTDAYGTFINDSYWLLHPFKYFDPGVHLDWAGRTELSDGTSYPTVHLTFEEGEVSLSVSARARAQP